MGTRIAVQRRSTIADATVPGIASYGFDPIVVDEQEWSRFHGNDERVSVDAFKRGVSDHLAIIRAVVYE